MLVKGGLSQQWGAERAYGSRAGRGKFQNSIFKLAKITPHNLLWRYIVETLKLEEFKEIRKHLQDIPLLVMIDEEGRRRVRWKLQGEDIKHVYRCSSQWAA